MHQIFQPEKVKPDNPVDFTWSASMLHESRVLGPSADPLGLPSLVSKPPTQQQSVARGYVTGQIHLALEVFSMDQLKQLINLSPECVHERGK